jgi:hypothetical protein
MKKNILLLSIITILFSCGNEVQMEVGETPKNIIGYEVSDAGEKISLYSGDMSTVEVWENYLTAHNAADLDAIMLLNAEDIKVWAPKGEYINGSDAHIEFLTAWFTNNTPKWKTKYMIANEVTKGDVLEQWVTSGHDLTLNVDGDVINVFQVHDALIVDGKVQKFYVNERVVLDSKE